MLWQLSGRSHASRTCLTTCRAPLPANNALLLFLVLGLLPHRLHAGILNELLNGSLSPAYLPMPMLTLDMRLQLVHMSHNSHAMHCNKQGLLLMPTCNQFKPRFPFRPCTVQAHETCKSDDFGWQLLSKHTACSLLFAGRCCTCIDEASKTIRWE